MNVRICLPNRIIIKNVDSIIDYVCAISIIMIMPFFYFFNSSLVYGVKFSLGIIFLICVNKKDRKLFKILFCVLLSGLMYTLYYLYNVRLAFGKGYASFFGKGMLCWLYMSFGVYYAKYRAKNVNFHLGKIYTVVLVITIVTSIIGSKKYSYMVPASETIMRAFGNGGKFTKIERDTLNINNIANWQLTYAFAFSTICYAKRYKQDRRCIYILLIALIIYFQIKAQITFALLFSLVPIALTFVYDVNAKRRLLYIVLSIPVILVILLNAMPILKLTYELMQDIGQEKLALRFYQLYESSRTGRLMGTGAGRIDLYMISIKKFLRYPILGYKLKGFTELYTEIGLHSQIFDTLAGTGIIGFSLACFPFLYIIIKTGKYITDRTERYYFKIGIAILFIFMLTNPTSYSAEVYMVVFCLPFWINGNKNMRINAVEVKKNEWEY